MMKSEDPVISYKVIIRPEGDMNVCAKFFQGIHPTNYHKHKPLSP